MANRPKSEYYSLESAANLLSIAYDDLQQFIITGQLVAAFVYHKPRDFREIKDVVLESGASATITRTNRTELRIVSPDFKPVEISYLSVEDAARILLNKVPGREVLVGALFFTPSLEPKHGRLLPGESSVAVEKSEIVVTREELERFAKGSRIKLRKDPIERQQATYRPWYDRPIGRTGLAILGAIIAGVMVWVARKNLL